jgi:hypothetical protein
MNTKRDELLKLLHSLASTGDGDPERAHSLADAAILEYLADEEISKAYDAVPKWYA